MDLHGIDTAGRQTSLAEQIAGNPFALLWFYPRTLAQSSCTSCSGAAGQVHTTLARLVTLGCVVVGAGYDPPDSNRMWMARRRIDFPYLTVTPEEAGKWGARKQAGELWQSQPRRMSFLLDRDLNVVHTWTVNDAAGHLEQVAATIERLAAQPVEPRRGLLARIGLR